MASWTDTGLILGGRRFGEGGLILDVLTESRGRRAGLVYGGASRRRRGQLEAGNTVELSWSGRLEEQLGRFDVAEAVTERAAEHLDHPQALAAIAAVTAILRDALDEGAAAGSSMYEASVLLLGRLGEDDGCRALY
ncbi:MAG: recombination protein O N-terminal domain-containing protein, partial [Pseudomonadota bacterium]